MIASFILRAGSVLIILLLIFSLITSWWTWKRFFGAFCFASYVLCVGGTIYCVLNESPFWYDRGDRMMLFYPQFNQQFWFEGFLAGSVMLTFAFSLIFLHDFAPHVKNPILKYFVSILAILVVFAAATTLVMFFTWKNEHYMSGTRLGPYIEKVRDLLK
jgi:magnesium-transporting ATPase (P-type)